ncbi:FAD-dependent oxidoreductase domain-containing protein 1 isoform X2 [Eleginops maclovinus]|uniref:FAD-dependent oxidoreductase domain-containing protein 1 isoform X2 n=1 Tax=Eleginops maclovinus TaxID=56733 RepID=UPI00307FE4E6
MSTWRGLHVNLRKAHGLFTVSSRHTWKYGHLTLCKSLSTGRALRNDFFKDLEAQLAAARQKALDALPGSGWSPVEMNRGLPPERTDVVIVGGGVIGWSVAYWIKQKEKRRGGVNVVVVEKDPTEHLHVLNEDPVDLQFNQSGYLFLANEEVAHIMEENYKTQRTAGAKVSLLSATQLKEKFPWINTEGVALASYGLENEGWFDPWTLLQAFKRKALSMGVVQCLGEVTDFKYTSNIARNAQGDQVAQRRVRSVKVQVSNSLEFQPIECALVVNAAGAFSGTVAAMLGIPLPVEPRKRYIYVVNCPDGPGLDTPFLIDYSGVWFRREGLGGNYIAGTSPEEALEPDTSNLEVDHQFFEEKVWPHLASRVPALEKLKVTSSWAGFYDYNTFDQNGIIGLHPLINNMFFATGFSGHGLQHSPAVGRAVAELIMEGDFTSLNLSNLGFRRILQQEPMLERNIV